MRAASVVPTEVGGGGDDGPPYIYPCSEPTFDRV